MAKEPKDGVAYSRKDIKKFTVPAKDADDDIDYEAIDSIYNEIKIELRDGINNIKKKLQQVNLGEDVLLVDDKSMKRIINDFSDALDEIPNAILKTLMEIRAKALRVHDQKQAQYNLKAQETAEENRDEYDSKISSSMQSN